MISRVPYSTSSKTSYRIFKIIRAVKNKSISEKFVTDLNITIGNVHNRNGYSDIIDLMSLYSVIVAFRISFIV
jgi:hypothetical protein